MRPNLRSRHFPASGYLGLALTGIGWYLAWGRPAGWDFFWENAFFPLWLGYVLVVNGLCRKLGGSSPLERQRTGFFGMFLLSIPGWWLFEFFNRYLQNWHYILNRPVSSLEYGIRASVHFSIVIPAVLSTAELWHRLPWFAAATFKTGPVCDRRWLRACLISGLLMLAGVLLFPRYCFPLVWVGVWLVLDSLNHRAGAPSLFGFLEKGDLRPFLELALGALTCGFFWEFWNYYALPKWVYTVPFVDFWHIFEMPVLGYLGYLPFGLEVFALYIFFRRLTGLPNASIYRVDGYVD